MTKLGLKANRLICALLTSLSLWQSTFLTAKRKPTRRSFQPMGPLINILGQDCLATAFLGTSTVMFCIARRHALVTKNPIL